MVTARGCGARKSAAPVGNNVERAHDMYPSVLNWLMGGEPLGGHDTVGVAAASRR